VKRAIWLLPRSRYCPVRCVARRERHTDEARSQSGGAISDTARHHLPQGRAINLSIPTDGQPAAASIVYPLTGAATNCERDRSQQLDKWFLELIDYINGAAGLLGIARPKFLMCLAREIDIGAHRRPDIQSKPNCFRHQVRNVMSKYDVSNLLIGPAAGQQECFQR
jgi:hypothetical protein